MRRVVSMTFGLIALVALTAAAQARAFHYMSQHPVPKKIGQGFCYIDVPHVHDFGPSDPRAYRLINGEYYFVGDPAAYDYEGPRYAYYGAHPIVDAEVTFAQPTYCYLRGAHYHWYSPPAQAQFELKGGAYWYVGTYEPIYYQERPRYVVVNEVYTPMVYTRPVVDIRVAPPSFHGEIVAVPGHVHGAAVVGAPVVSAGVYVAVPPPPSVHLGVSVGGPPVVVHDHGRHRGWYGHGHGHGHGYYGPPPGHGGGWRGGPGPAHRGGWRGGPPPAHGGGWRGGPPPQQAARGGGFRGAPQPAARPAGGFRGGPTPAAHHGGGRPGGGWKR